MSCADDCLLVRSWKACCTCKASKWTVRRIRRVLDTPHLCNYVPYLRRSFNQRLLPRKFLRQLHTDGWWPRGISSNGVCQSSCWHQAVYRDRLAERFWVDGKNRSIEKWHWSRRGRRYWEHRCCSFARAEDIKPKVRRLRSRVLRTWTPFNG